MQNNSYNCIKTLKENGLILYPTDTVWGIGCDATNPEAVKKVYELKKRHDTKALVCLVADLDMLKSYVKSIPDKAQEIIESAKQPTTIIFNSPLGFADNLIAADQTIAIRIPNSEFCIDLIKSFKKPIVSTSANISGESTPKCFEEISDHILKGVDYVVNLQNEKKNAKPSSIIRLEKDGTITTIRA